MFLSSEMSLQRPLNISQKNVNEAMSNEMHCPLHATEVSTVCSCCPYSNQGCWFPINVCVKGCVFSPDAQELLFGWVSSCSLSPTCIVIFVSEQKCSFLVQVEKENSGRHHGSTSMCRQSSVCGLPVSNFMPYYQKVAKNQGKCLNGFKNSPLYKPTVIQLKTTSKSLACGVVQPLVT